MEEPQQKKLYYCSYEGCASYFDRPYRLAQHFLAHNNIRPFPCKAPNCNKAYTSKSHLDRHISSVHLPHENDVVYSCPQCLKSFANRQNLKRHMNTVHLVEFICDICKLAFKKKNQLSAHMYEHTGLKAFKCDLCSDTFISLYLKKRHMRYHKTYTCEECNVVFNHWSKYQKHKKTEHVSSLFICNVCKKTFKEKGHMVKHLKTHGQKRITKTFPCPYDDCSRFYSRKSNLKQHILVKHMKILHECMICHAQLSTKAKLNYHIQLHYREGGIPIAKPKTEKNKERKPRKDEGSFKFSTALKLSGLNDVPEETDSAAESTESPINLSVKSEHIEVEVDVLI
ncbi:oocyte zinc finger protein XlCOF26-like isoform X2 [Helicoverpa zea]|uniref:oocyte zinc finger protein XlCOF26-like isoform X2 n=1 Tax=Helicoverpa zea TaxID=7113 RepID=UPI001F577EF6|nr:oocyte zinc finger protein XlCOF26-like isoform X2 [Helicoverpa zea]